MQKVCRRLRRHTYVRHTYLGRYHGALLILNREHQTNWEAGQQPDIRRRTAKLDWERRELSVLLHATPLRTPVDHADHRQSSLTGASWAWDRRCRIPSDNNAREMNCNCVVYQRYPKSTSCTLRTRREPVLLNNAHRCGADLLPEVEFDRYRNVFCEAGRNSRRREMLMPVLTLHEMVV